MSKLGQVKSVMAKLRQFLDVHPPVGSKIRAWPRLSRQDLVQEPQPLAGLILAVHPEVRRPPWARTMVKNGDFHWQKWWKHGS